MNERAALLSSHVRDNEDALVFDGFINIAKAGNDEFTLAFDDGSELCFSGKTIVDIDTQHGVINANRCVYL